MHRAAPTASPPAVWVVLPTYEEVDNVGPLVARLRTVLAAAGESFCILIVDDASPDGTGHAADFLAAEHAEVVVLHRTAKQGLGAAYAAGFDFALQRGAAWIVQMDADGSHDPADVPRLLAAGRAGADVVLGSRYVPGGRIEGWPAWRRVLSRFGSGYARCALGLEVRDLTGGFKCFSRAALIRIPYAAGRAQGYAFQVEVSHRAVRGGLKVVEIPIVFTERRLGRSKMTPAIALEAAWTVPRVGRHRRRALRSPARGAGLGRQRSDNWRDPLRFIGTLVASARNLAARDHRTEGTP